MPDDRLAPKSTNTVGFGTRPSSGMNALLRLFGRPAPPEPPRVMACAVHMGNSPRRTVMRHGWTSPHPVGTGHPSAARVLLAAAMSAGSRHEPS